MEKQILGTYFIFTEIEDLRENSIICVLTSSSENSDVEEFENYS